MVRLFAAVFTFAVCADSMLAAMAADVAALVAPSAEVTKVVGDCKFTEGPAFSPRGFLLFSDIPNNRIIRVEADGAVSDFLKPSGKANGLVFDAAGHLYACQGEARRVVRISGVDGKIEVLADKFDGKLLNSPNDLALDTAGGLYFTDPRYGMSDGVEQPVMGVYYISSEGKLTRVIDALQRPNGILVSSDGQRLYVAEPNKRELWQFRLEAAGKPVDGKVIFTGDEQLDGGGPDGMCLDAGGRIYATYKSVVALTAEGKLIGRIPVPEQPANCTFGGSDSKTLYITARTSLYSLKMNVAGQALAAAGPRPAPQVGRRDSMLTVRLVGQEKPAEAKSVVIDDITLKVPATWKQQPPANNLRKAQFAVPAAEGDKEPAELVVSFFRGDGGGVDPNLKRWNDQFSGERKIVITQGESSQGAYYFSDVSGVYQKPIGPPIAGKKEPTPGYRSVGVVLQIKDKGNYFLRLTGPDKTVVAATADFRQSFGGDAANEKPYVLK